MLWNLQQMGRQECSAFLFPSSCCFEAVSILHRNSNLFLFTALFQSLFCHLQMEKREMRPTLWFCTVSSTGGHAQSPGCAVPRLNWNQLVLSEHFRTKSSPPRLEKGELLMQLTKSVVLSVGFDPIALWVEQSCCLNQGQSRHKPFWSYFTKICWPIFLNLQLACFKRGIPFFNYAWARLLKSKPPDHEVCFIAGALLHAVVGILRDRHPLGISVALNRACRAGADGPIIPSNPAGRIFLGISTHFSNKLCKPSLHI